MQFSSNVVHDDGDELKLMRVYNQPVLVLETMLRKLLTIHATVFMRTVFVGV